MLIFQPSKRITVQEALNHPFMESLHVESDEPVASGPISFAFENMDLDRGRLQSLLFDEVRHFHPEASSS